MLHPKERIKKMKNINKILGVVALGALALTSCDDSILDVAQYDKIDISGEFSTDEGALDGLTGVYDLMNPNDAPDADWGFKPNLFSGTHPTMDTQATGWDAKFNSQNWDAGTTELAAGWAQAYAAIARANLYLDGLEKAESATYTVDANGTKSYIAGTGVSDEVRVTARAEARCLRGFFYTYLAQTFGRVPMLEAGDDYNKTPEKARAKDYNEMWDFIINDFSLAADSLNWTPYNNQYGRATKGMALAYLADAYMWKAYRLGCNTNGEYKEDLATTNASEIKKYYQMAEATLDTIITYGPYKLNPSFCTNWDVNGGGWNDECIWAEILDENSNYSGWNDRVASMNLKWYVACPENGGWGSLYLSWEWYAAYEQGDKRRDASCVIGAIPQKQLKTLYTYANKSNATAIDQSPKLETDYQNKVAATNKAKAENEAAQKTYNDLLTTYKKYVQLVEDYKTDPSATAQDIKNANDSVSKYKDLQTKAAQTLSETKVAFENAESDEYDALQARNHVKLFNYGYHPFLQVTVGNGENTKTKRFHFTNGEYAPAIWSSKFWRNASAENLNNVGCWGTLVWGPTNIYWKRFANVLLDYAECRFRLYGGDDAKGWDAVQQVRNRAFGMHEKDLRDKDYITWLNQMATIYKQPVMEKYPIPFDQDGEGAPDAKSYYTAYAKCNIKGKAFTSPVWKVAVNEERRKEFSCEWCLRPDLQRSGYMRDHIETNYPKDATSGTDLLDYPWSPRTFDFNEQKMDMPIPSDEISKNPACDQNPAYVKQ